MEYQKVLEPEYDCIIFDVDDTLYPLKSGLSEQCTKNIKEYMIQKLGIEESKVPELCHQLYVDYGTTMAGLKAIGYNFDDDDYHRFVHGRLPYEFLKPDPVLRSLLHSLPIRKVVFSNADKAHVAKVLGRLGLEDCFEGVICFETLNTTTNEMITSDDADSIGLSLSGTETFKPITNSCEPNDVSVLPKSPIICKPFEDAFEQAFKIAEINPKRTLFFDDSIRNIQTGKCKGLHTVWVGSSHRTKGVDYALESIHNMREALPELWEAIKESEVCYSEKTAIETPVRA
ncbi:uncharacterized protein LOC132269422 [Cornus florida]|uniref:uncharacterized protein LOC132269422 n=1 Tax=Cornus florida TaxID=4283 RepID=UPI00289C87AE|nr:uncharacterized protein LOC132269422 [Cornus florida]XP_059626591.1 uncharacterized protein LOC132269422 [Cornus florida]